MIVKIALRFHHAEGGAQQQTAQGREQPVPGRSAGAGGNSQGGGGQGFQRPGSNARPGDSSDIVGDPIGREALLSEMLTRGCRMP